MCLRSDEHRTAGDVLTLALVVVGAYFGSVCVPNSNWTIGGIVVGAYLGLSTAYLIEGKISGPKNWL